MDILPHTGTLAPSVCRPTFIHAYNSVYVAAKPSAFGALTGIKKDRAEGMAFLAFFLAYCLLSVKSRHVQRTSECPLSGQ